MTPCYICEDPIEEIRVGPDLRPLPCSKCLAIVAETVAEYDQDRIDTDFERAINQPLEDFLSTKRKYDVI